MANKRARITGPVLRPNEAAREAIREILQTPAEICEPPEWEPINDYWQQSQEFSNTCLHAALNGMNERDIVMIRSYGPASSGGSVGDDGNRWYTSYGPASVRAARRAEYDAIKHIIVRKI